MNSINLHRITSITMSQPKIKRTDSGELYSVGHLTICFTDYSGNPQEFYLSLFGEDAESLNIKTEPMLKVVA